MTSHWVLGAIGAIAIAGAATCLSAAELNLPVACRILSFLQPEPTGAVTAAIIFEPGVDESEAEAARLEHAVGAGLPVGKTVIHVRRVSATDLAGLAGVKLAFVTTGVRHQQDVAAAAARQSIVTVTPDMGCVQTARCVVGISSGSPLQIVVSRAAARAASIRFGSAFLMLVKEI